MNGSNDWLYMAGAIFGLTIVTISTRGSFFVLPARYSMPVRIEKALRYAPGCALAAIVLPSVLVRSGHVYLHVDNYQLWAVLVASAVFAVKRNLLLMMGIGMLIFTLLRLYA